MNRYALSTFPHTRELTCSIAWEGQAGARLHAFFAPVRPCLASALALRVLQFLREEEKERAEPSAALMAARRNIAGMPSAISVSGKRGEGFFSVAWVRVSRAVSASLAVRSKTLSCA